MQQSSTSKIKYRILQIIPREPGGVEYHRQIIPHTALMKYHPEFEVVQIKDIDCVADNLLKQFNLIQFNRIISNFSHKNTASLARLRKLGIATVCDMDDYWMLSHKHILRGHFAEHQIASKTVECIMGADHVTVTHELLGQMSELAGKKWSILANAIDPDQPQFKVKDYPPNNKIEFGWVGGACHLEDIELLRQSFDNLCDSGLDYSLNLCGYTPELKIYQDYEKIFTSGGKCSQERYHRLAGMNIYNYANLYDALDVALVPLNNNLFNRCKSNLKLLEAGFKKKAVICSNIHPYTSILDHGNNGLKVNITDNERGWYKMIERYCKNPNMILDHAAKLYEDVQAYHIERWSQVRADLYKELIERKWK